MRRAKRCRLLALGQLLDLRVEAGNTWGFCELGLVWERSDGGGLLLEGLTEGRVMAGKGPDGAVGLWVHSEGSLGWLSSSGIFEEMELPGEGWRCGGPQAVGPGPFNKLARGFPGSALLDAPEGAFEGDVWPWPDDGGLMWSDGPSLFRRPRKGPTRALVGLRRAARAVEVGPQGSCWCEVDGESWGAAPRGPLRRLPDGLDLGAARFSPCGKFLVASREGTCLLISLISGGCQDLGSGEPVGWREEPVWRDGERLREANKVLRDDVGGWPAILAHGNLIGPGGRAWDLASGQCMGQLPRMDENDRRIVSLPTGFCLGAAGQLCWLDKSLHVVGMADLPPGQRVMDLTWDPEEQAVVALSARGAMCAQADGRVWESPKVALFRGLLAHQHTGEPPREGLVGGRLWRWDDCGMLIELAPEANQATEEPT